MSARSRRRSFATPFVITLVAAPACFVSSPPPQGPSGPAPTQPAPTQPDPAAQPPLVVANPPRPTPAQPQPQAPPAPQNSKWTVYKAKAGCMAAIKVECVPNATCNPPPPFSYVCPEGVSLDKPITIATYDGTSCFIEPEPIKCPPNTMCNPPRPRVVACPKP